MTFETRVTERLKSLIHRYSEVGTTGEANINVILYSEILELEYFKKNPDHCGLYNIEGDLLNRQILWSYIDNGTKETVILFGHCDTVGIDNFNDLMPYALEPDLLKEKLIEANTACEDLHSDDWLFGRGSSDMKAGLAIQLTLLEDAAKTSDSYPNILWLSVPDEEHLSAGMRSAAGLIKSLKTSLGLKIPLAILSEPHDRQEPNEFVTYAGSAGKMKPVIVARGIETHAGDIFSGFNAVGIITEIVKAIELNTEMSDLKYREMTSPPAFMGLRDLKQKQDVTTPEFIAGFFNWNFLANTFEHKFEQLKRLCLWSLEDAVNQYNYSKNQFLRKQLLPSFETCSEFDIKVYMLEEVRTLISEDFSLASFMTEVSTEQSVSLDDPMLLALVIKQLMIKAEIEGPAVVIGLLPPFYPAKDSTPYYEEYLAAVVEDEIMKQSLTHSHKHFFMKISDMSYLGNEQADYQPVEVNMPHLELDYHLDFEVLDQLNIQVVNIGPWGKDLHLKTERVYLPDVTTTVPNVIKRILKQYNEKRQS